MLPPGGHVDRIHISVHNVNVHHIGHATAPSELDVPRGPSPYLSGNYAPVDREVTATDLAVRGRLPDVLSGHFVRNGPNPVAAPTGAYSWFGGDGMLHIVELDAGRARSYRNRWVRTPTVARALGEPVPAGPQSPTGIDLSNTSTARLGTVLLSLTEGALPYVVTPDGATVGRTDLGGGLTHGLSAHAKHDPVTGEIHQVGYDVTGAPYAVWQVIDPSGRVARTVPLDLPAPVMIHTATLTPRHVLVYDLPVVFDLHLAVQGWSVPFRWDPDHQARLGVLDRSTGSVTWIALPPIFVFHDAGAYDTATGLVVDLVTYRRMFATDLGGPVTEPNRLERWTIDTTAGTVERTALDDRPQEFPRVAPGTFGLANRFTYVVAADRGDLATAFGPGNAVVRHDHRSGAITRWSPGPIGGRSRVRRRPGAVGRRGRRVAVGLRVRRRHGHLRIRGGRRTGPRRRPGRHRGAAPAGAGRVPRQLVRRCLTGRPAGVPTSSTPHCEAAIDPPLSGEHDLGQGQSSVAPDH